MIAAITLLLAAPGAQGAHSPPLPGLTPCQWQPPFTISSGPPESLAERMGEAEAMYRKCHGRAHGGESIAYWSYPDGSLRRQRPGEPAEAGAKELFSLMVQSREQQMAIFWLTWFHSHRNGGFCHLRRPMWTDAEIDRTANDCFRAMTAARPAD
ncbi:MAG TPA: hypothetical protein VF759_06160 [Allosphingosinicella sp.]|jgi:hypothetical protein